MDRPRSTTNILSRLGVAACLLLVLPAGTFAQAQNDHLKCYQVKDALNLAAVVDLNSPQFGLEAGCKVSKAKFFCVPVEKTVISAVNKTTNLPIAPLPVSGPDAGDRVCYKVKCPIVVPIPDQQVTDQFGTRTVTKFKASYLCTPAVKGTYQRFVDNGDTVTDNQTGLQWEKKVAGSSCPHCVDDGYSWCVGYPNCTNPSNPPDGTAFTDFLGTLNNCTSSDGTVVTDAGFAGHCDWRLPTSQELGTIFALQGSCGGGSGACIDPIFGPTVNNGSYWSATSLPSGSVYAWLLNFNSDITFSGRKGNADPVRAVRRAGP